MANAPGDGGAKRLRPDTGKNHEYTISISISLCVITLLFLPTETISEGNVPPVGPLQLSDDLDVADERDTGKSNGVSPVPA